MRKRSSAIVAFSALSLCVLAAQGCSSGTKSGGFFPSQPAAAKDAGGDDSSLPGSGDPGPLLGGSDDDGGSLLTADAACATATAQTTRDPVYLLFVVDGSGSMGSDSKWVSQTAALDAIFDDMLTQKDPALGVGLIVFSDTKDPTYGSGPYPSSIDVPTAYVDQAQHDKLRGRIDPSTSGFGTPTFAALSGAYPLLENFSPAAPLKPNGHKVIVLMTDGVPDGGPSEQNQCTAAAGTELKLTSPKGPIDTFAIGVGPFPSTNLGGYDPSFLGRLAQAGGTAPAGCDPASTDLTKICHFQVTPNGKPVPQIKQDFIDAINKIRGQVSTCEFSLSFQGGQQVDPSKVNVIYTDGNGQDHVIPQDPTAGWSYDDPNNPQKVILNGTACTQVKGDPKAKVSVLLGCKTRTN